MSEHFLDRLNITHVTYRILISDLAELSTPAM